MKKVLLTFCLAGSSFLGYSQFTPGNLVVLQENGTANEGTSVSIVEYTKSGAIGETLNLPSTGAGRVVLGRGDGAATLEGFLKLSVDSNYITFGGYDADAGTAGLTGSSTATVPRLVVHIDKDKNVTLNSTTGGSTRYVRFAVAKNINEVYVGGNSQTLRYLDLTTLAGGDGVDLNAETISNTSAGIFYGDLYLSRSGTASTATISKYTGLPTAGGSAPSTVISRSAGLTGNLTDFMFFDTDSDTEADLAYIGSDGSTANITKFKLVSGSWVKKGTLEAPVELLLNDRKLQGMTGYRKNDGTYAIYYSTFSSIVSLVDTALPSDDIVGTPVVIASAPTNTIFRGLSFTPGTTPGVLPVELKSFTGKAQGDEIRLAWSTVSEKNNSHFEILRSANGIPSEFIGTVPGSGNSDSPKDYSFVDQAPLSGTNYYQLRQVDANGVSKKHNIIAVKSGLKESSLTVSSGQSEVVTVNVYSVSSSSGIISITDVSGRTVTELKVSLNKGYNTIPVNISGSKPGVYVVTLNVAGKNLRSKFVK